jgi:hypothetical protein
MNIFEGRVGGRRGWGRPRLRWIDDHVLLRPAPCRSILHGTFFFALRLINWLWWGETMSQNCGHQRACCSPPGDIWAWITMVMMMPAGGNFWLVHQSSLAVLPADTSVTSRRNGRRSENFAYRYLKYLKGSLTCRKILRHGTFRLYFSSKGRRAADFLSPLRIHRLGRVWTLDPWVQWQAH